MTVVFGQQSALSDSFPANNNCLESAHMVRGETDDGEEDDAHPVQDIETEVVSLVAGLHANSSIPYGVIPSGVESYYESVL
jgi:hypothetical protein